MHITPSDACGKASAEAYLLELTIKGAKPIRVTDIVLTSCTEAAQRMHPEYFSDLPALR